jgi:hypothetical protein
MSTVKELQSLGFSNFFRKFIKAYSHVAAPLTRLLKNDVSSVSDNRANDAFESLKTSFTTSVETWSP